MCTHGEKDCMCVSATVRPKQHWYPIVIQRICPSSPQPLPQEDSLSAQTAQLERSPVYRETSKLHELFMNNSVGTINDINTQASWVQSCCVCRSGARDWAQAPGECSHLQRFTMRFCPSRFPHGRHQLLSASM